MFRLHCGQRPIGERVALCDHGCSPMAVDAQEGEGGDRLVAVVSDRLTDDREGLLLGRVVAEGIARLAVPQLKSRRQDATSRACWL